VLSSFIAKIQKLPLKSVEKVCSDAQCATVSSVVESRTGKRGWEENGRDHIVYPEQNIPKLWL